MIQSHPPTRPCALTTPSTPRCAIEAIETVVGNVPRPVALHEPRFAGREWDYVKETLDSGWVSSVGKYVDRFETMLAERCEVPHAIATVNGTAALHACLLLAGVAAGDEVLLPSLTFIATANAVSYCGAIPHFCDSEEGTLGLDPDKLDRHLAAVAEVAAGQCRNRATGRRIAAVVPMHTFGQPVRMDRLSRWRGAGTFRSSRTRPRRLARVTRGGTSAIMGSLHR